jgi:Fe-Mn family superoxide dismutase
MTTQKAGAAAEQAPFTLPALPYPYDALEPYIDAKTVEIHHTKHHAAYVNNLNKAVANYPELAKMTVEELIARPESLPEPIRMTVRNNGGGHAAHSLYWQVMTGKRGTKPNAKLAAAIDKRFGNLAGFFEQLDKAAIGQFGSGWAWLSLDGSKELLIEATPNHDSPLALGHSPLLVVDVWEHAYYLKYQNRRADYVAAFHNLVNWDYVSQRY